MPRYKITYSSWHCSPGELEVEADNEEHAFEVGIFVDPVFREFGSDETIEYKVERID